MKKLNLEQLLERIELFDDAYALAESLYIIEAESSIDRYYLKECSDSLVGMFELLMDIKRSLK